MKAITLTQPWATLVAIGAKRIETRSWKTDYRGPLAIHAAKTIDEDFLGIIGQQSFYNALAPVLTMNHPPIYGLPVGCIVATCELVFVEQFADFMKNLFMGYALWKKGDITWELTPQERVFGDYTIGRYGWFLANVKPLPKPIPCKGALGLWNVPVETLQLMDA